MAEMVRIDYGPPKRPAGGDEICCCGEPASVVFLTEDLGPVPFCGMSDADRSPPDCPLLVGLTKDLNKPACIEIVGVDDKLAGYLTAYEDDQLARILAVTLRSESQANARR